MDNKSGWKELPIPPPFKFGDKVYAQFRGMDAVIATVLGCRAYPEGVLSLEEDCPLLEIEWEDKRQGLVRWVVSSSLLTLPGMEN